MKEIILAFGKLGLISFGGPVAHIGYLREEFVARRQWLTDEVYADLVALCQFLPGPTSSQTVFGLGLMRHGLLGGILASLFFTLPSATIMILFGYGMLAHRENPGTEGWLQGLKVAAVAVVANAVVEMARKLCPDATRKVFAIVAAIIATLVAGAFGQIASLVAGAVGGLIFCRAGALGAIPEEKPSSHFQGLFALGTFLILLVGLPMIAHAFPQSLLLIFNKFYQVGSLVFGGGHVVLPLLQGALVPQGWTTNAEFLAGYGAAQALPGPLFSFAGYLGTVINHGAYGWTGGVFCLAAIFLPGFLLVAGALPFWTKLRRFSAMQRAMQGTNAAVVGILLAALYNPIWLQGITSLAAFCLGLLAWAALALWKLPPWLVVGLCALSGQLVFSSHALR